MAMQSTGLSVVSKIQQHVSSRPWTLLVTNGMKRVVQVCNLQPHVTLSPKASYLYEAACCVMERRTAYSFVQSMLMTGTFCHGVKTISSDPWGCHSATNETEGKCSLAPTPNPCAVYSFHLYTEPVVNWTSCN